MVTFTRSLLKFGKCDVEFVLLKRILPMREALKSSAACRSKWFPNGVLCGPAYLGDRLLVPKHSSLQRNRMVPPRLSSLSGDANYPIAEILKTGASKARANGEFKVFSLNIHT